MPFTTLAPSPQLLVGIACGNLALNAAEPDVVSDFIAAIAFCS